VTGSASWTSPDDVSGAEDLPEPSPRHAARPLGYDVRVLDRVRDMLPPSARGRAGFTSHHVTVIALLVACVTAVGAWLALRSTPQTVTVPTIATAGPTITSDGGAATPAALGSAPTPGLGAVVTPPAGSTAASVSAAATIVVDVAGKVRQPGIVELSTGARVVDAIDAAGGAKPQVDLSALNLARPLVDGEQILIGVPPVTWPASQPSSVASPSSVMSPAGLVNLNTASQEELESLPGVGPVTATAILTWRTEHGAFSSVDELLEVSGIGDATLADLAPLVTV
jgi:competence protein ComEA